MTEYHKIETLYERDEKTFKLIEPLVLKNRAYGLIKTWKWSEKIDGTNIRITWVPGVKVRFDGREKNSQLDTQLLKYLQDTFTVEKFEAAFKGALRVVLYGEGMGAGIQKGAAYSPDKRFILFDVLITTLDKEKVELGDWWLSQENVEDVASKLGIPAVPIFGEMTLEEATEIVRGGFYSKVALETTGQQVLAEGLVGRPCETLFDKKGARMIVKLKTKDFAKKPEPAQLVEAQ